MSRKKPTTEELDCLVGYHEEIGNNATTSALRELQRIRAQHEWIPVSEKLPEENMDVLTCMVTGQNQDVTQLSYKKSGWEWITGDPIRGCVVTHWMPLPAAPETPEIKP